MWSASSAAREIDDNPLTGIANLFLTHAKKCGGDKPVGAGTVMKWMKKHMDSKKLNAFTEAVKAKKEELAQKDGLDRTQICESLAFSHLLSEGLQAVAVEQPDRNILLFEPTHGEWKWQGREKVRFAIQGYKLSG